MSFTPIHEHVRDMTNCEYLKAGQCWRCCYRCNVHEHTCPGCGADLDHNGLQSDGTKHEGCTD